MMDFVQYKRLNKKNYTSNPHARFHSVLCNPSYLTICIRSRKSIVDILDYQTHKILLLSEMTTDNLYLNSFMFSLSSKLILCSLPPSSQSCESVGA